MFAHTITNKYTYAHEYRVSNGFIYINDSVLYNRLHCLSRTKYYIFIFQCSTIEHIIAIIDNENEKEMVVCKT